MADDGGALSPPFLLLPTLRHSGTNFCIQLFGRKWWRIHVWTGEEGLIQTHFDYPVFERMLKLDYPVVIPLRHPDAMAKSHLARYGHLDFLKKGLDVMRRYIEGRSPCFLPIDSTSRDAWLQDLNSKLELRLSTNWPVVDSRSPEFTGDVPDIGHSDFFARFYVALP